MSLFGKTKRPPATTPAAEKKGASRTDAGWAAELDRSARTQAQKSLLGRDIARGMPAVVDPHRREASRNSFELYCRTYFPQVFNLPWSNDHRRAIHRIETAVREGGLFAYALPRGSGKTSIVESAISWATLSGYRQFPLVIGSDESSALELLDSVKSELESNDLLMEDFPEVCYPIRCLKGIAHKANGQLFDGKRTQIYWSAKEIVLPTIPGSAASGAVLAVTGITGRIRGMKFKRPDGASVRPDLVVIDDPQTDESAKSPSQCAERIRILCGAVLGLAGPGKKVAAVMPCTVIYPGDMADELLDRQKHPEWQGERTKLVYKFPGEIDPDRAGKESADEIARRELAARQWEQYKKVRSDGLRAGGGGRAGTEFYRANREAMDYGAVVAWAVRHNPDELSAIQHAMNLRADLGDRAFFAEYQNDPQKDQDSTDALTAEQVAAKTNGRERGEVPNEATRLTAFIDVQKTVLYWAVCAWEDDFTGYVIDYGTFPDQRRDYFSMREVRRTLASVLKSRSLEETIYQGLKKLTDELLSRKFKRDDGGEMSIDRDLIDANWGDSTDVIYQFCRESAHSAVLVPTHGKYVGATSRPFEDYRRKKGDEIGDHWRRPTVAGRRAVRYGLFDSNHWKTFLHERLAVPSGGPGCLSLFGDEPQQHKLLAEHVTAEEPVRVEAKDRVVTEWKIRNTRPDNHFLDCLVGCCVGASMLKISLAERKQEHPVRGKRIKLSEIQARKAGRQ